MREVSTATSLTTIKRLNISPTSVVTARAAEFGITTDRPEPSLLILAPAESTVFDSFDGVTRTLPQGTLLTGPQSPHNAEAIRNVFPWLRPTPLGLRTSAGFGDRLGLATTGHIRAMQSVGGDLAPIYAQQSIREMDRTGRTAQAVIDDAMWAVFANGWRAGYGADADHLKTTADIDLCVAVGFTFFTFDPSDYVGQVSVDIPMSELRRQFQALPLTEPGERPADILRRFRDMSYKIEHHMITFDERRTMRAALKYSRALAHVVTMYAHLARMLPPSAYEIEISVDETDDPTTHAEHIFIASELRRLGVPWVSLAPRFIGRFEKGVEYIGRTDRYEEDFAIHADIARYFGPYKLSLHSGSDKFSIYAASVRATNGCVHLKTAGTSFLEALRVVARHDPELFRPIYCLARDRYETDKTSYHVSARISRTPLPNSVTDHDLPALLDDFDVRQILHVTFGSVLNGAHALGGVPFGDQIQDLLRQHPESYAETLQQHFIRHLRPFVRST